MTVKLLSPTGAIYLDNVPPTVGVSVVEVALPHSPVAKDALPAKLQPNAFVESTLKEA